MIGTGEYTTGYVDGKASDSDKGAGVVALTMFDLRRKGKVNRLGLCGVNGKKFPGIRSHMKNAIGNVYSGLDLTVDTYPDDNICNPYSYIDALSTFKKGDVVKVKTVAPEGPITKMRMDEDGTIYYLVSWSSDNVDHERWFTEDQIVAAG
jgi:D-galacturonate reductase